MNQIKRLFFDIETSPNIGFFWSPGYKISLSYDNIIKERAIICICYKWAGEDEIHSLTWDGNQSDKKLLEKFIKVANTADEIVGHNGDKFDLPWVRTRCLFHKIPMFPNYTTVDTLKHARSKFRFNSNRLDYIAKFLGIGSKISTSYDLWKQIVLNKDKKALEDMVTYCKKDVALLEEIYNTLSPYIPAKTHHGVILGQGKHSCPECGSTNMVFSKKRMSALGVPRIQLQCKDCGKYHTVSNKTYEESLDVV
jgi:DNA polymerase elongation subunit (family B)/ribosomal protein S27E